MLAAHLFEERRPCPGEAGVAIHAVERKRPKLLPALHAALGGERLAALAGASGRNSAAGATLPLPEAVAAALRALIALAAEAPDEVGGASGHLLRYRVQNGEVPLFGYTYPCRDQERSPLSWSWP